MGINTQCQYNAMLGKYRDLGFSLYEEEDVIDEDDKLVVIYFKDKRLASYYKSKLIGNVNNVMLIQQECQSYWNNIIGGFANDYA